MLKKDTAYSWVVLVGVAFTVLFVFGEIKSFGVLLPELTEQLGTDTWVIGSFISLMTAWGYTVGEYVL